MGVAPIRTAMKMTEMFQAEEDAAKESDVKQRSEKGEDVRVLLESGVEKVREKRKIKPKAESKNLSKSAAHGKDSGVEVTVLAMHL